MSIYEHFEKHSHRTFGEAALRYLKEFRGKDVHRQAIALRSVAPYIDHLRLIEVDDEAMSQFKHDRVNGAGHFDKPAMKGTVNKELTAVITVLNKACRVWRWIPSAPKFLHVDGEVRKAYPLTWDEQMRLFEQMNEAELFAALFAINTGVRKSELFGLKWEDMKPIPSLDTFVFILRNTKNGKDRAVIVNSIARRAVKHMADMKHGSEYVFPATLIRQSGKVWAQFWKRAGLPSDNLTRKGIHNLRHSCAARLRAADVPDEDRAFLLGHNNASLVQHYALPDIERLSAMAERITTRRDTVMLR